jgi:hypothetical protein
MSLERIFPRKNPGRFIEYFPKTALGHGNKAIGRPRPIDTSILDGNPDRSRGNLKYQHAPSVDAIRKVDPKRKRFRQVTASLLRLFKCMTADHPTRPLVGYAENDSAAALVCQSAAIFCQIFKRIAVARFLEFEMLTLCGLKPLMK